MLFSAPLMSIRRAWLLLVCASCAVIAGRFVAGPAWSSGFPLDDAWIHMVYGRSLFEGAGFAYNTGLAGSGATSPLWALVAAAAHLSTHAAACLKVFGLASHALAAALAARVAQIAVRPSDSPSVPLAAGIIVAVCPALAFASVSGMEVSLASALLLATLAAAAEKRVLATAVCASLAISTRPEALVAVPFVALLAARGSTPKAALKRIVLVGAGALVLPALWTIRNVVATGRVIPSTIAAKALPRHGSIFDTITTALITMLGELRPMGLVVGWLLVGLALVLGARKARAAWRGSEDDGDVIVATGALIGLAWVIGLCVHTDFYTPRWFYFLRYPLPALPLFLVCAVVMVARIGNALAARLGRPPFSMVFISVVGIAAAAWELADWPIARAAYAHDIDGIDSVQVAVGKFLAANVPKNAVVWSPDAGAIRYFGGQRIVDLEKLNTSALSWDPNFIVLIMPFGDRAKFDDDSVPIVFEAPTNWRSRELPPDWPGPMPTQVVVFCPPGHAVEISRSGRPRARGHCAKL